MHLDPFIHGGFADVGFCPTGTMLGECAASDHFPSWIVILAHHLRGDARWSWVVAPFMSFSR